MELVLILGAIIISFILVVITIPPVIRIAEIKKLYEPFEQRKIHTKVVPPLGGVAIFIAFIIGTVIATDGLPFNSLKYIITAVIIMFFIGLKDDIYIISPGKKFMAQLIAAILLIVLGNIRFTNLHGIFGIHEIGYLTSISITLLIMIGIINAFNLIDGIDGLASGLAILSSSVFGTWFYLTGNYQFSIMAFALMGSLMAFFLFNVFGDKNKMFMGDTGSLIIGIVLATLVIQFNELNLVSKSYSLSSTPAFSFAVVSIPVLDTLRVFLLRITKKKSPFSPDRNHVHHRLLTLIPDSHLKVTLIIISANILLLIAGFLLNFLEWNSNVQLFLLVFIGMLISYIPSLILKSKKAKEKLSTVSA